MKNIVDEFKNVWNRLPVDNINTLDVCYITFVGFITGLCSGAVIALFRIVSNKTFAYALKYVSANASSIPIITIWFLLAIISAFIVGYIIRNKDLRFGGSEWTRDVIAGARQLRSWHEILIPKFIGSCLVMTFGISVGREGPSIQMGAATALGLKKFDAREAIERKYFLIGGAAAGLAAAFSAPFVGICYVYEILREKIPPILLTFLLGGSFGVYTSTTLIFGLNTVLPIECTVIPNILQFWIFLPLALFASFVGVAYNYLLRISINLYHEQKLIPFFLRPLLPFIAAATMVIIFPTICGEGLSIFPSMNNGQDTIGFLLFFIITKLLFTIFCYGSGIPAGLMVPLLCLGGVAGGLYAFTLQSIGLIEPAIYSICVVMGMVAAFTAGERAPLTGLVLVLEMTGAWAVAPAMLIVVAIASLEAKLAHVNPV